MPAPDKNLYTVHAEANVEERVGMVTGLHAQLLSHFHLKAEKNKRLYLGYKYASIILAAFTTLAAALQILIKDFPSWMLPILSAAATVSVAMMSASGAQKIWINSRTTQKNLQTELFLFNQQTGRYNEPELESRLKIFSYRLIELWDEGHGKWEQSMDNGG